MTKRVCVAVVLVGLLAGCGSSPTGPTVDPEVAVRYVEVKPMDVSQQSLAEQWWPKQAACVGVEPRVSGRDYPVRVHAEPFECGGVEAAGCMRFTAIDVVERWYEAALSHEFIHLALWKKGEGIGHGNSAFAQCDTLNYVAPVMATSGMRVAERPALTEFGRWLYASDHQVH